MVHGSEKGDRPVVSQKRKTVRPTKPTRKWYSVEGKTFFTLTEAYAYFDKKQK